MYINEPNAASYYYYNIFHQFRQAVASNFIYFIGVNRMKSKKLYSKLVSTLAVSGLLLAGCGSGGDAGAVGPDRGVRAGCLRGGGARGGRGFGAGGCVVAASGRAVGFAGAGAAVGVPGGPDLRAAAAAGAWARGVAGVAGALGESTAGAAVGAADPGARGLGGSGVNDRLRLADHGIG